VLAKGGYRGYYCLEWEKRWHPEIEEPEIAFPHYAKVMREYLAKRASRLKQRTNGDKNMMQPKPAPEVKWGEWIGEGWQLFVNRWQVWVPLMLIFVVALLVPILPVYLLAFGLSMANAGDPEAVDVAAASATRSGWRLITFGLAAFMLGGVYPHRIQRNTWRADQHSRSFFRR
jgi:hypothetical protein